MKVMVNQSFRYLKNLIKWLLLSTIVGVIGGVIGSIFHLTVDFVTEFRHQNSWVIFLLPVGGVLIAGMYRIFQSKGKLDTNRILEAVKTKEKVPLILTPLIFISTVLTHFLGGSAGREGAALQLGGSIGYNIGKLFRLNTGDTHIIVMSGMSAVFAALFGTPITATFFALEVVKVGVINYAGLVSCTLSAIVAYAISLVFGVQPVRFLDISIPENSLLLLGKVIVLALLCAMASIVFCVAVQKCERYGKKLLPNRYLRGLVGGAILILLTLSAGCYDYNGAGMDVIANAMGGQAKPEAFLLKIIFTAITIAAGFKGGEIVPTFFVGATFGYVAGDFLGLDPGFSAAIGFVALFCGVVNCPIASLLLSIEVFGTQGLLTFAVACGISYMMSGYFGLYKSQEIVYSKLSEKEHTRKE